MHRPRHSLLDRLHPQQLLRFSVWRRVQFPVYSFALWSTLIYLLNLYSLAPAVSSGAASLVGILSMVTGLMVSFRSSSSYDRWYEGRRLWAGLTGTTRNVLRQLAFALPPSGVATTTTTTVEPITELANLFVAFPYATMYHLRDQSGLTTSSLSSLLPSRIVESYSRLSSSKQGLKTIDEREKAVKEYKEKYGVELDAEDELVRAAQGTNRASFSNGSGGGASLPLFLIRSIHAQLNTLQSPTHSASSGGLIASQSSVIDGATYGVALGALKEFTDHLTALERIRDTPIPLILNIHLQLLLFVYVGSVPLQLVRTLGFWSIPATAIAALVFYGVDRAAEELSDPFGEEPNDLPVGRFCKVIEEEWNELVAFRQSV